jgi:O-acetyl-ADP-ribose deacetylase (regulator of RNase III)
VLADELGCTSLALPAISTGIFGFPKDSATRVILAAIQNYFNATTDSKLARVVIVLYSVDMAQLFAAQAGKFFKGN